MKKRKIKIKIKGNKVRAIIFPPKKSRKENKKDIIQEFLNIMHSETKCGIQYSGCPCNTCFHTWAEDELGLSSEIAHMFWIVMLTLRGDGPDQIESLRWNKEFFEDIIKKIK